MREGGGWKGAHVPQDLLRLESASLPQHSAPQDLQLAQRVAALDGAGWVGGAGSGDGVVGRERRPCEGVEEVLAAAVGPDHIRLLEQPTAN